MISPVWDVAAGDSLFQSGLPTRRQLCSGLGLVALGLALRPLKAEAGTGSGGVDRIVVLKSERRLLLQRGGSILATFPVALGAQPTGPKLQQGDARTPEGLYHIDAVNPHSRFHRALHISYPNAEDLRRARAAGVPPGGDIEIHGLPDSYGRFDPVAFFRDWTNGCIAVGNRAIEEITATVGVGTPVEILA
jgi:murein L,D-transpeptidase YafK